MVKKAVDKLKGQLSEEEFFLGPNLDDAAADWLAQAQPDGQLAVDVYQTKEEVVVKAPIAGVPEKDIDITVHPDQVLIRGERKEEREVAENQYHAHECFWGNFSRLVMLPARVDQYHAKATFKNGILTVRMPKTTKAEAVNLKLS